MNELEKYADIINMPHHVSKKHKQMSLYERSAQFAPFAALTGHEAAINETGRLTEEKIELDEEEKELLDRKLNIIIEKIENKPTIKFTYFIPDLKKKGGKYTSIIGIIKKVDLYNKKIILEDKKEILLENIIDVESDILNKEKLE